MEPLLLIDVSYMAHRAYHALGALAHGGEGTAVIFGVLRDVINLQDRFQTSRVVFAFDHPAPKHRQALLPSYKSTRKKRYAEESEVEQEARKSMRRQLTALYKTHLHAIGFRNVFASKGFEADDVIASVARAADPGDEVIIISSDQDLWQCVAARPRVMCWNPHRNASVTITGFTATWGLPPGRWAEVKAIAGCSTDDVPGVKGVGETTAAKYLRGELGAHTKAHAAISAAAWRDNLPLVQLPFTGTPTYEIQPDEITENKWETVAEELGMKSISATPPRGTTKQKRGRKPNEKRKGFFK